MTREEFNKILDEILPPTVGGMVRPAEPIPTDLDFCTEFRQFLQADMNLANHENAFLRQLFSNDKQCQIWIDELMDALDKQDFNLATQKLKGLMSAADKAKVDGMQAGAEVNQNAFSNLKAGAQTVAATTKTDTLELAAGTNIAISASGKKITVGVTGIANGAEVNQSAFSSVQIGTAKINAAAKTDTLTIAAGKNISIVPDAANKKITIQADDPNAKYLKTIIDLTSDTYSPNTWYPVYSTTHYPNLDRMSHVSCCIGMGTCKPTWSTHEYGCYARLDILAESRDWGAAGGTEIQLANNYAFVTGGRPIGYRQMSNCGKGVFYLRAGAKYYLTADYSTTWAIVTTSYTEKEQTIQPQTTEPPVALWPNNMTGLNYRMPDTACKAGDITYSPFIPSWAQLECITAGTTAGTNDLKITVNAIGQKITDGTCEWVLRHKGESHNVGDIWMTKAAFNVNGFMIHAITGLVMLDVHICDGTNGTVNMVNRFPTGTNVVASIGTQGGANSKVITAAQMPVHTHGATAWTDAQGAHAHGFPMSDNTGGGGYSRCTQLAEWTGWTDTQGNHAHNVGISIANAGGSAAFDVRPAFTAVAFVQKIY